MTAEFSALLTTILAAVLPLFLVAVAAIIGLAWARKTVLIYAIVGIVLYLATEIGIRMLASAARAGLPYGLVNAVITASPIAIQVASQLSIVGAFVAVIHSAYVRRWEWFGIVIAAALVTALGGLLQNTFALIQLLGNERAFNLLESNNYLLLANVLFCVSFAAQILYGILGSDRPTSATIAPSATNAASAQATPE